MQPAVVIEKLEWRYEHGKDFVLRGVDLAIGQGEFLGIVGPNEQGKTTLVSCMNGMIPHVHNGIYRGSVKIFGCEAREMDALDLATEVGLVFSDPESQFTAMTIEDELVFGMENLGLDKCTIRDRLRWATDITMIDDLLDKSPYDISGGQKQRVAIAAVLAMNPKIMIFDEPTSMLDPIGKRMVFDILHKIKQSGEHTIIVVEHNMEQLAPLADKLLLMHMSRIVELATPALFFENLTQMTKLGVNSPEVTQLSYWLREEGLLSSNTPLPVDFQGAVKVTQEAIRFSHFRSWRKVVQLCHAALSS
jgi:energy-coupling factor transport system ATP-binding protein